MHRDITIQNILYFKGNPPEDIWSRFQEVYIMELTGGE